MSDQIPQINAAEDDELSIEELEEAAGGLAPNENCGGNCGCTVNP